MIFRVGFLVLASVAAFAVTQRNSSIKNISENDDSSPQQEQIEEEEKDKFEDSNVEPKQEEREVNSTRNKTKHGLKPNEPEKSDRKWDNVNEIVLLKNAVNDMEQRRVSLEVKLLDLYGLREQQIGLVELQNQLKAKMTEIDTLDVSVNALQAEREKLHEEIKLNMLAENQLEIAKKRISEMQAKICVDAAQMKGQLMMIKEQVFIFQVEENCTRDAKVEKKLKVMKDLQLEVVEMRRRNKELQLERRELAIKLAAAQARITALCNTTESKTIAEMEKEMSSLSHANENLTKQAEKLHKYRFGMIEELVYQRWLNTCLRVELQDYQTSKNSSRGLPKKIKLPILDFSSMSISSSSEGDKITRTTIDSSSSSQRSSLKKYSLIQKIKRWRRGENDSSAILSPDNKSPVSKKGPIRRYSMSMVPLKTSMVKNRDDNTGITPSFQRKRRVSFNDSVKTVASTFEDGEQLRLEDSTIVNTSDDSSNPSRQEIENNDSSNPSRQEIENNEVETQEDCKINETACTQDLPSGMLNVLPSERKVGAQLVNLIAAFFIFLLVLVVLSHTY